MNRLLPLGAIVLFLVGCGGSAGGTAKPSISSPDSATAPDPVSPTPTSSVSLSPRDAAIAHDNLTGFGALPTTWRGLHVEDRRFESPPGTNWDPDPSIRKQPDFSGGDRFTQIGLQVPVISFMKEHFPEGTSFTAARASAFRELPADAHVRWVAQKPHCVREVIDSPQLALLNGPSQFSDGYTGRVLLTFFSLDNKDNLYQSGNVNQVEFGLAQTDADPNSEFDC